MAMIAVGTKRTLSIVPQNVRFRCQSRLVNLVNQNPDTIKFFAPVEGNQVFVALPKAAVTKLHEAGVQCHTWDGDVVRFVASFNTSEAAVDNVVAIAAANLA